MRTRIKKAFRPSVEAVEARVVATAGLVTAGHLTVNVERAHAAIVAAEAHKESPKVKHTVEAPKHQAHAPKATNHTKATTTTTTTTKSSTSTTTTTTTTTSSGEGNGSTSTPPASSLPTNTTTNQAWVELVNMTGRDLEYQIKLGPYDDGQFLDFDIAGSGSDSVQYRYSSLISNGQRVEPDFAIQFGNGPVTPLLTGISQQSAQGYYIFMSSDGSYYVSPIITMQGSYGGAVGSGW